MALHPDFPDSPYTILDLAIRWFPANEALRETSFEKLLPPLVLQLRKQVQKWRNDLYHGATEISRSLLNWWFNTPHLQLQADGTVAEFQYYFPSAKRRKPSFTCMMWWGSKISMT